MAIYSPPKQSYAGSIISGVGDVAMTAGGIMTATGVGAIPGLITAGVGAIAKTAGSIIDASNQQKINSYNEKYKQIVKGEENSNISAFNNSLSAQSNYNSSGINSSIKAINNMLEPMSTKSKVSGIAGTILNDNRLI